MHRESANIRALFLHNLSDALASVAVVGGGALILLFGWRWVDPVLTIAIAGYILWLAVREIGGPIRTLMLGSPPDIATQAVLDAVRGVEGVADLHHAHFWQLEEREPALDAHVVLTVEGWARQEAVKGQIKRALAEGFGIRHSTLEFEHVDRAHRGATLFGRAGREEG